MEETAFGHCGPSFAIFLNQRQAPPPHVGNTFTDKIGSAEKPEAWFANSLEPD